MEEIDASYARRDESQIAYAVRGSGRGLAWLTGTVPELAVAEDLLTASYYDRVARFSRLVIHDPRGSGRSDPLAPDSPPSVDDQASDLVAVLDDAGLDRVFVGGFHAGAGVGVAFAARYPERTEGLFIVNGWARMIRGGGYPYGITPEFSEQLIAAHSDHIGTGMFAAEFSPSRAGDPQIKAFYARVQQHGLSRAQATLLTRMAQELDVRELLGRVSVPTIVMHNRDNGAIPPEHGRYLASGIPGARFIEFDGTDHFFLLENPEPVLIELEAFVTSHRPASEPDHAFVTVVFADLVGSTTRVAEVGDRRWRELIDRYERDVAERTHAHGGRVVKTTGDGVLAVFSVPSHAVRCARAVVELSRRLGLEARIGIHAGEVELRGNDVTGLAVHIGARVGALAEPGEVLVTRTIADLLAGSGFHFTDQGTHTLKGVPGRWDLYSIRHQAPA